MSQTLTTPALDTHLGDPWRLAEMLGRPDVLCHGHYRLLSGLHSDRFVRFSKLADDPHALGYIADLLAGSVASWQPDAIAAPSTAGVSLGVELSRRLGLRLHLSDVGDEGRPTGLIGAPPAQGSRILVVNDVITTGEGVEAIAAILGACGAQTIGCCAFMSRTLRDLPQTLAMLVVVTASAPLAAWSADDCPMCAEGEWPEDARDLN